MVQACLSETSRRDGCDDGHSRISFRVRSWRIPDGRRSHTVGRKHIICERRAGRSAGGPAKHPGIRGSAGGNPERRSTVLSEDPVSGELSGIDVDLAYEAASRIFGCTPEEARENNAVDIQTVTDQTGGPLLYDGKVDLLIGAKSLTDPFTEELNLSSKGIADPENGAAVNEGEEGEAGNDGSNQANDAAGEPGQPAETAPEVFREMWPERFSADGSEIAEADENATNESAGSGNDGIESAGNGEVENGEVISDTPEQEESPTREPTQHWDFTQEYAEGRVLTVLHEKEGLSSQMNRLMQELVNSGKLIQITEKYTKSDR